jgi:dihydropyrimidine dehydrogenase (NAD+) subunit PreT
MVWTLIGTLVLSLSVALLTLRVRRADKARMQQGLKALSGAKASGSHKPRLQYPNVDLSRCLGCATCISACPEAGVLDLIHGQAVVVHGARCVGHGLCETACPVGAITVALGDMGNRRDIPALSHEWEVQGRPGLFLAGEVTGYALIRTAINHGVEVANVVAARGGQVEGQAILETGAPSHGAQDLPVLGAVGSTPPQGAPSRDIGFPGISIQEVVNETNLRLEFFSDDDFLNGSPSDSAVALAPTPASRPPSTSEAPPAAPSRPVRTPNSAAPSGVLDLCIVGAGPAGLACALRAKELGLDFVVIEQEEVGGTVAKYPRRKLVMTQPVDLPLYGRLKKSTYRKEELMAIWQQIATDNALPVRTGEIFERVDEDHEHMVVHTQTGAYAARHVCLALGRRGTPRKLGVPGEELPKVIYSLTDAQSYTGRHVLVVGGGDSSIEAAVGLAEQPGNTVTLSYRKAAFFRIKAMNDESWRRAVDEGRLEVVFESQVSSIAADHVRLSVAAGDGGTHTRELPNDDVFVMIGGIAPFKLLEGAGVSFDPADRPAAPPIVEQGTGMRNALLISLGLTLLLLGWVLALSSYYDLPRELRFESSQHDLLRPTSVLGLTTGVAATLLILANICYLLRRSRWGAWLPGSLRAWMTSHLVTGILAVLLVMVHGGMDPRNSLGGHAFWSLVVLVITGTIGRYFYAFVPHAANGKEVALEEVRNNLAELSTEWDATTRGFGSKVRERVESLVTTEQWEGAFWSRLLGLFRNQRSFNRMVVELRREGRANGLEADQIERLTDLSRRANRTALMAAHFEDLRALLGSWRFVHRWVGLLMVLLATWHIVTAVRYAGVFQ